MQATDPALTQAIEADRLRRHAAVGVGIVLGTVLVTTAVALQFWPIVTPLARLTWVAALVLILAMRLALPRQHGTAPAQPQRWLLRYRWLFAAHGLLWLSSAYLLAPMAESHALDLLLVALALLACSALVMTSFDMVTAWCFAGPALAGVPLVMGLAPADARYNPLLPALLATFCLPMAIASRRAGLRVARAVAYRLQQARALQDEQRQAALLERVSTLADVGGWEYDLQARQLSWTPHALHLLGLPPHARPTLEQGMAAIAPAARDGLRLALDRAMADGRDFELELPLTRADGSAMQARVQCRPLREQGRVVRLTGALHDITEARRVQQDLRAYESVLNAIHDMASMIRDDDLYVMVNDAWCRTTGIAREQVVGHDMRRVVPGSVSDSRRRAFLDCLETGSVQHHRSEEMGLPVLRGRVLDTTFYPHRPDASGHRFVIVVTRDVTAEEQARLALATSAEYLRRTLNATGDGIFASDATRPGEPVRFVNDRMLRLWGIPREKGPSLSPADILEYATPYFEDAPAELRRIQQIVDHNLDAEDRLLLRDGRVLLRRCVAAGGGRGTVRVWSFRDITAEEQAVAALVAAKDEAQSANRAKSHFLSQMSHELRTPLNAILGFAQLLELRPGGGRPVDRDACVREILRGGRHLLSLINDLLDLAGIESGRMSVASGPLLLRPVVDETMALMQPLADSRSVRLLSATGDALGRLVRADPVRLRQVLLNLLGNAVKYNRAGGEVQVLAQVEGAQLRLVVRDTGPGLTEQQQARLFQPFERLDAGASGTEGHGIGLALSRLLVQAMDGDMGVDSTPGQGSRFWLQLPLVSGAAPVAQSDSPAAAMPPAAAQALRGQVLYIEDNAVNAAVMEAQLTLATRLTLHHERHPLAGLERARRLRPDLILLDLQLPDIDGFEVLRRLRTEPATAGIPVVAVSAEASPQTQARTQAAGFDAHLTKPLELSRLVQTLQAVLSRH
ncbi:MAG: ATP-binding protein [Aquabacterium sp.]